MCKAFRTVRPAAEISEAPAPESNSSVASATLQKSSDEAMAPPTGPPWVKTEERSHQFYDAVRARNFSVTGH